MLLLAQLTGELEYKTLLFGFWNTETPLGWETSSYWLLMKITI